ncbi:rCG34860, partial [Rattus norvegicus]
MMGEVSLFKRPDPTACQDQASLQLFVGETVWAVTSHSQF